MQQMRKFSKNQSGFSLAEAMLAVTVLAIAAGGVLLPYSSSAAVHVEGARITLASKLASDLLEEISLTDYDDIVDDWDGYSEQQGEITKVRSDELYTDEVYDLFSRSASCQVVTLYASASDRLHTEIGVRVTVTVNCNGRQMAKISTLVSEY